MRNAKRAALALARASRTPPRKLEVYDVGPADDGWVLLAAPTAELSAVELTTALRDVLDGVVRGETNGQIAARRGTSIRTVENQVATLLAKLGASSRVDLVRKLVRPKG